MAFDPAAMVDFFTSTKLPILTRSPRFDRLTQVGKRSDPHSSRQRAVIDDAMVQDRDIVADSGIADAHARVNLASGADDRLPFDRDPGVDDGVGADLHIAIDERGRGIFNRHAGRHERGHFRLAHDAADRSQLGAAVDAPNFVGIHHGDGLDAAALRAVDGDEIGQVVLVLRVFGGDAAHRFEEALELEGVDARVDFPNRLFGRRRVLLFDDPFDAIVDADDPAISVRLIDHARSRWWWRPPCCRAGRPGVPTSRTSATGRHPREE